MIELNVTQGSPEWHAARANCFNASEAPAMMGVSPYKTRTALIAEKATGIVPDVDAATQARFDNGHAVEAAARPLVEQIIGEELYPVVATDDNGKYLASSDGATMLMDAGFEHKAWNEGIAAEVREGNVPESHRWQLDHQFLVFGFEKILFVVSNGTAEKMVHCWYYPQPERIAALVAGWEQFAKDVAAYVPSESKPAAVAEVIEDLPALTVQLVGNVTASNLPAFQAAVLARIQAINTNLVTDNDFATADKMVKFLDDGEKRLDLVKSQALAQTSSIDELFRTIDSLKAEMRSKRLTLDRLVKAEKEARKSEITSAAATEYAAHCRALNDRIAPYHMPGAVIAHSSIFGEAIKGLKSLDSMRDKLSVALANAKIEANAIADRIEANRKTVEDMSLFPDFIQVCTKAPEDFAALLAMRVSQRKEAEEKRLAAEREKIRAEEQAKAQREAEAKAAAERKAEAEKLAAEAKSAPALQAVNDAITSEFSAPKSNSGISPVEQKHDVTADQTIKLGEICARLGFTVSADFLASLGMHPVATEKNAKLYPAVKFQTICRLIQEHLTGVMQQSFKQAA